MRRKARDKWWPIHFDEYQACRKHGLEVMAIRKVLDQVARSIRNYERKQDERIRRMVLGMPTGGLREKVDAARVAERFAELPTLTAEMLDEMEAKLFSIPGETRIHPGTPVNLIWRDGTAEQIGIVTHVDLENVHMDLAPYQEDLIKAIQGGETIGISIEGKFYTSPQVDPLTEAWLEQIRNATRKTHAELLNEDNDHA